MFIFIEKENECKNIASCFENIYISVPKIFNIEINPLIVTYDMKLNEKCDDTIKEKLKVDWNRSSSLFRNATISDDKKNYTLNPSLLEEGIMNFKIDILFEKSIVSSMESWTKLMINKVRLFF